MSDPPAKPGYLGFGVYVIYIGSKGTSSQNRIIALDGSLSQDDTPGEINDGHKWIFYPVSASPEGLIAFRIASSDGKYILSHKKDDLEVQPSESSFTTWNIEAGTEEEDLRVWTREEVKDEHGTITIEDYYVQADSNWNKLAVISTPKEADPHKANSQKEDTSRPLSGWKLTPDGLPKDKALSWSGAKARSGQSFQEKLFHLTPKEAAWEEYDIIIVGSGIGGGVLANDLYDTNFKLGNKAKRVLLLERGGLVFHTHCLNTARPAGLMNDRGQQNDTFFNNFRHDYTFDKDAMKDPKDWNGGPMYNLGGRSAAWGLFAPRVHEEVIRERFPTRVAEDLAGEFYDKAERLMLVSLPTTRRAHQHIMDRLDLECRKVKDTSDIYWQWGRIASEFHDDQNFDFAEGAYSAIDKILEIAMSRPKAKDAQGKEVLIEHTYFKTVLNADVRSLNFDIKEDRRICTGVNVRGPSESDETLKIGLREGGKVVLCAGSVNSPAILLRSKALENVKWAEDYNGLRLTDHDIVYFQRSFRFRDPAKRAEYGAMKLQTYVKVHNKMMLLNMSIDASSFLPRGHAPDENLPKFIMVFMHQQDLLPDNSISLDPDAQIPLINKEPRIDKMKRGTQADGHEQALRRLVVATMKALAGSANLEFVGFEKVKELNLSNENTLNDYIEENKKALELGYLQLGGVAHELGTLPMRGPFHKPGGSGEKDKYCLNKHLSLRSKICKGVSVCDLSLFPHSPAANPTLTLAALAIRLSRKLVPRLTEKKNTRSEKKNTGNETDDSSSETDESGTANTESETDKGLDNVIRVVNHSGSKVQVFLTNRTHKPETGVPTTTEAAKEECKEKEMVIIEAGDSKSWIRPEKVSQALFVFKLNREPESEKKDEKNNKGKKGNEFTDRPIILEVRPGPDELTTILPN
ncbi:unnamed protein product [Rhizoctonia solani]|nr:unnamed protein product [Rhizoctonia solani]